MRGAFHKNKLAVRQGFSDDSLPLRHAPLIPAFPPEEGEKEYARASGKSLLLL
jgi:hypothetical protein